MSDTDTPRQYSGVIPLGRVSDNIKELFRSLDDMTEPSPFATDMQTFFHDYALIEKFAGTKGARRTMTLERLVPLMRDRIQADIIARPDELWNDLHVRGGLSFLASHYIDLVPRVFEMTKE